MKFYICSHCGQVISIIKNTGVPVVCCGEKMKELVAGTTDAAVEKHVPVYNIEGNQVYVKVGSVEHPMTEDHYIEWIVLKTKQGVQVKYLKPNNKPEAVFLINVGEEIEEVLAYCNLHSLWKA